MSVFNRLMENCKKSPIHREHMAFAIMVAAIEVCANVNIPRPVFTAILTVMVLGREVITVAFDEFEMIPVRAEKG